jgi:hypothetical protein
MTKTCATSSTAMMHVAESKTGIGTTSALNRSNMKRGTMMEGASLLWRVQCKRSQGLFPRFEEGALAPELQAVRNREV